MKNLEKMSVDELKDLQKDVEKALIDAEKRRYADAKEAIKKVAQEYGVNVNDLLGTNAGGSVGGKKAAPQKYANPDNRAQTWSGRGRRPYWVTAALEAGTPLGELLIERGERLPLTPEISDPGEGTGDTTPENA